MATTASLHKNRKSTLARIKRFLAKDDHFSTSANQIRMKSHDSLFSQLYSSSQPVQCSVYSMSPHENIFEAISSTNLESNERKFAQVNLGDEFGPTWSSHLFLIKTVIPPDWVGKQVHLRWNSSSEAMLLDSAGNVLQGFIPKHRESFTISKSWDFSTTAEVVYYVQMTGNGLFGALGEGFSIDPPNPQLKYKLKMVDIAVFEPLIFKLYTDLELLVGMAEEMADDIRGFQALYSANEMINLIISKSPEKASKVATKFFSEQNGSKAHTLVAMGHCHIDTAWLWNYNETKRKCARSWSSQIELMKEYPDIVFTCSQMQQLAWMKEDYPGLYGKIKEYVSLQRFIPVGGTWVEMDGLLPDGESFIRQFFYGQKFLQKEFGIKAKEFWLPDTFGYSGQIPQIMKHMGINRFLTQKISWNRVNKFPHHSFWWEGIDGSKVLTHFPPGDSYEMNGWVKEILKSVNNSEDKGRTNIGAYLYGFGDGGGGPTVPIIERLIRLQDVDGLPKVKFDGPDYFFSKLELDSHKLCKWVGELYLEMHNGTYTSQAKLKWYNRKLEMLLKVAELKDTLNGLEKATDKSPQLENNKWLEECWKGLLLNQFHDVIPGSCIELVVQDALEIYHGIFSQIIEFLSKDAFSRDLRLIQNEDFASSSVESIVSFNPLPWAVKSVFCIPVHPDYPISPEKLSSCFQYVSLDELQNLNCDSGKHFPKWNFGNPSHFMACHSELLPSGYSRLVPGTNVKNVVKFSKTSDGSTGIFSNGIIKLEFSLKGVPNENLFFISSKNSQKWQVFKDYKSTSTVPGMFYIYDDNPECWDAWDCDDYHLETRQDVIAYNENDSGSIEVVTEGPLVGVYKWKSTCMPSRGKDGLNITRYTIMKAGSALLEYITVVHWAKQSHKFLKAEFPINVLAREASYEIQYGHIRRPTHSNTSWDMAQIEVSAHKWVDLSQSDRGVSLINDSKYGFQIKENVIKLSLLRSPKAPDENCDMHKHVIRYGILPHDGSFQESGTVREAYQFNTVYEFYFDKNAIIQTPTTKKLPCNTIITSHEAIIAEVVKLGYEQPTKTICIRLYESFGGSSSNVTIKMRIPAKFVIECDGMEEHINPDVSYPVKISEEVVDAHEKTTAPFYSFQTNFSPFQIKSFLIHL